MYSEPTISPNFVVRQKRKLIRHPLIIGGVILTILFMVIGIGALITSITTDNTPPTDPDIQITFESSITFASTPQAETTAEPDLVIQASDLTVSDASDTLLSSQPQAQCKISTTGDTNVNIRSGPAIAFSLISSLSNRSSVDAIAVSDNQWFQIMNTDGTIGWVGGSVVDESGDCANLPIVATPVCTIENTTGNRVNIRDKASTSSSIIRTLSTDDLLMADGHTADGWYRILLTGELGWIYQDVVALSDACATTRLISAEEPAPQPVVTQQSNTVFNEEDCVIESFTGSSIDLREGPGMEFAVTAKMNKAMSANRISSNGWYEVGNFGWAFAGDLVYRGLCNLLPTVTPEDLQGSIALMSQG